VASATDSSAERPAAAWSLESRLRRRLWAVLVLLWLAGSAIAWVGVRHETTEVLDSALVETAQRLLVLPEGALGDEDGQALAAEVGSHEEHVIYQVFDARGRLRLRSHRAPATPLLPPGIEGLRDEPPWHVVALTRDDGRRRVLVAEDSAHRRQLLASSGVWMVLPLLALLPLTGAALHWGLRSALRSVERAGGAMRARDAGDLSPLPLDRTPSELRPLLEGFNALLARLRDVLDAERLFAARSAHELRTPLAAARAQAQRLLAATHEAPARVHGERLLAQLDRLARLSSRLLQIARVESGIALRREPVDLVLLARLVADEFRASPEAARLRLDLPDAPVVVDGDIDALSIALRNLIDNALKHAPGAPVQLRVDARGLAVEDGGPGIDAASLDRMRRPFERGPVDSDGVGLGLAMVESVARQSGARLELQSPLADGRGLRAALVFEPPGQAAGPRRYREAARC
jgi:two-component system, OmpR family, sensor kinase